MELVRVVWIFIFFFFALILIFMWSKMAVISSKINSIARLVDNIKKISGPEEPPGEAGAENGRENQGA